MQPESLVQLLGSGNTDTVEEEWMRIVEAPDVPLGKLAAYQIVLAELRKLGRSSQAESLAWAALEAISSRCSPAETLSVARPFLLGVGESEELRKQVLDLYRQIYGDQEGLDALIKESGIGGGRPVRRALRTLEVCLAVSVGDYLVARDEDAAARVEAVDRSTWEFTLSVGGSKQTLGAVHLADGYEPASATDFRVLRHFAPDQLTRLLRDDPAAIVIDLCKRHDNRIDSTALEQILVPALLSDGEWKKWWVRARTMLKRYPNVAVEGRSPYTVTYLDAPVSYAETLLREFEELRDPSDQAALIERYVKDCKTRKEPVSTDTLRRCHDSLAARAKKLTQGHASIAALTWIAAARVGEFAGVEGTRDGAINVLRSTSDVPTAFHHIQSESLIDLACDCLQKARPEDWREQLFAMLSTFPLAGCDRVATRLVDAGATTADFEPAVQRILNSPVKYFEAFLWLWDGPTRGEMVCTIPPVTLFTRLLRTLEETRSGDTVARDTLKKISVRARAVLPARKYERFTSLLQGLDPGMGLALKRQIGRSETLGRAVREDLLKLIQQQFPSFGVEREPDPWSRADVLFVTDLGMSKKQDEVEQHVNVKMKENARAIGRAAEHGDLSENSEYKFALEERDLLRARLAQMNSELAMAVVIRPDEVPTDFVGIGTRVVFKRQTDGQAYEMTFLSPWEADAAKSWFNYKAPLSQKLMGKRVGDVMEFDHTGAAGAYEIISLHNALKE